MSHLAKEISLWDSKLKGGKRYGVSGIISLFLCQIDDDKRRDTIQRLRQCKYDKKVTPPTSLNSPLGYAQGLLTPGCPGP